MKELLNKKQIDLDRNDIPDDYFQFPPITLGSIVIVGSGKVGIGASILLRKAGFKVSLIEAESQFVDHGPNNFSEKELKILFDLLKNDIEICFNRKLGHNYNLKDIEKYDFQIIVSDSGSIEPSVFENEKWFKVIRKQQPLNNFSHLNMYFINTNTSINYIKSICQKIIDNYSEIKRIKNDLNGKKIILGGSFNPPTIAHQEMAMYVLKHLSEKLVLLPNGNKYPTKELLSFDQRIELIKANFPNVDIDDYEKNQHFGGTVKFLELRNHPFFVIGTDSLRDLPGWIDSHNLIQNNKFIVFKREDDDIEQIFINNPLLNNYRNNFYILSVSVSRVSSSAFRKSFDEDFLTDEVYKLVIENNYYK